MLFIDFHLLKNPEKKRITVSTNVIQQKHAPKITISNQQTGEAVILKTNHSKTL